MRTMLLVALMLPMLWPPVASGSWGACSGGLGEFEIGDGTAAHSFYFDDRGALRAGVWLYEESNGVYYGGNAYRDLQRGGVGMAPVVTTSPPGLGPDNEVCTDGPGQPDTLIY